MPDSGKGKRLRKNLGEAVASLLEIPVDDVVPVPVFTIRGRREIEAEGCAGILEYTGERVVLDAAGHRFTVTGSCLTLENFTERTLTVRGRIASVSFGGEDGEGAG